MRLKLFLRRLTISAPRMHIRSSTRWPLRWAFIAIVLGFCAAIALWAFELGKDIAGLDRDAKADLAKLRTEVTELREERDKAQSIVNTSGSLLTAERAAQAKLLAQIKQLEMDNRALRDDLGFFEKLIPSSAPGISIRGLQVESVGNNQIRWQVLIIQAQKNAAEFNGKLELTFSGTQNGQAWSYALPNGGLTLNLKQYQRVEGFLDLPASTVLKSVATRVLQGSTVRATQTIKL